MESQKFLKKVGKNVDEIRKAKGMSYGVLASETGIDKANLVRFTNNGSNVTLKTLYKISKALDVTVLSFFEFEDE